MAPVSRLATIRDMSQAGAPPPDRLFLDFQSAIAGRYSLAWMDWQLRHDPAALGILRTAHPHFSYLWDSEVQAGGLTTVMRGQPATPFANA